MIGEHETLARISDAPWASRKLDLTIGGAGGLGSWLALFLSRVGHKLTVYDFDHVGIENIGGGQFYTSKQAGQEKTSALRQNIYDFTGSMKFTGLPKYVAGMEVAPITFTTFDNMEARKDMFDTWKSSISSWREAGIKEIAFINLSMLPEGGFIEVVDRPSRIDRWAADWLPSDQMPDLACTFKSTTHNAALMAAYGVNMLNAIIFNKELGTDLRYVPYRTTVDLNLTLLETDE